MVSNRREHVVVNGPVVRDHPKRQADAKQCGLVLTNDLAQAGAWASLMSVSGKTNNVIAMATTPSLNAMTRSTLGSRSFAPGRRQPCA